MKFVVKEVLRTFDSMSRMFPSHFSTIIIKSAILYLVNIGATTLGMITLGTMTLGIMTHRTQTLGK